MAKANDQEPAELHIRESEARLHSLYDSMGEGVGFIQFDAPSGDDEPADYCFVDMNRAFEQMTGLHRRFTLDIPAREVFHTRRPPHMDELLGVWRGESSLEMETRQFAPGRIFRLTAHALPCGRVALLLYDITSQKRAEQALRASEARFRGLFSEMSTGVAVYDAGEWGDRFIIKDYNRAGERIDHVRREDILGREIRDVFPGVVEFGLIDVFREVWRTGKHAKIAMSRYEDARISGWRENHVYRLPSGEIVSLFEDVSDRHLMESKIVAKQKMEAIGRLAGGVADDFSNLLGLMAGDTSAIMDSVPQGSGAHDHAQRLLEAQRYAGQLTHRLLSVARASDADATVLKPVELGQIVVDTVALLANAMKDEGIACTVRHAEEMPCVSADDVQLRDAVMNALINSVNALTGGGRIRVDCEVREIVKPNRKANPQAQPGSFAVLRIRDNGEGMSRETLDRVFEPFFSTDKSGTSMGLGLNIIQTSVLSWKGWVDVRSRPGVGTSLRLFIPVDITRAQTARPDQQRTVLVVDDQETYREAMVRVIESLGHLVLSFDHIDGVRRLVTERTEQISLWMLDAMLPGEGGKTLLAEILAEDPAARIVMISGFSHEFIRGYLSRGAWGFLQKPFTDEEVAGVVREALGDDAPKTT